MVAHGVDGWDLVAYDWNPETGIATCTYEREVEGIVEAATFTRAQPYDPKHVEWHTRL